VNIGILFGFLFGGWLNEFFGWRVAFVVVGVPGILIAFLVRRTLAEPIRGLNENKQVPAALVPFKDVMSLLWSRRSFRHLALAAGLNALAAYGTLNWQASFFIRSHGMTTGELGTWLALSSGLFGAIGVFAGGIIADRLAPRDKRWYVWLPAIAGFISLPFMLIVFLTSSQYLIRGAHGKRQVPNVHAGRHTVMGCRQLAYLWLGCGIARGHGPWHDSVR
jgi:predicted MFS family arabinose efflux permease